MATEQIIDGRAARSERTRRAVVDALLALNDEGDLQPSAQRIAARAGVSLRALWKNFSDMETLYAVAGRREVERVSAITEPVDASLPLPERIERFVAQRARVLELLAPAARAAGLREPFSPQLRANRQEFLRLARGELTQVFARELAHRPQRDQVVDALMAATTWPPWALLRDQLGLDAEAARTVMARTVAALLTAGDLPTSDLQARRAALAFRDEPAHAALAPLTRPPHDDRCLRGVADDHGDRHRPA